MTMPSMLQAAAGAFQCPAIKKLRDIGTSNAPQAQRRRDAHQAVVELRAFLDAQFASPMFGTVLSAARLKDKTLPDRAAWLHGWERVKAKMQADGRYVASLCDELPGVLARYDAANGMRIFGDPVLRSLIRRGLA
jgi:hypothetical protein